MGGEHSHRRGLKGLGGVGKLAQPELALDQVQEALDEVDVQVDALPGVARRLSPQPLLLVASRSIGAVHRILTVDRDGQRVVLERQVVVSRLEQRITLSLGLLRCRRNGLAQLARQCVHRLSQFCSGGSEFLATRPTRIGARLNGIHFELQAVYFAAEHRNLSGELLEHGSGGVGAGA